MITASTEISISQLLYGLAFVLVVLGAIIVIKGFSKRKKFKSRE